MKLPRRRMIAVIFIAAIIFVAVKTWVDNKIEPSQYAFIKDKNELLSKTFYQSSRFCLI